MSVYLAMIGPVLGIVHSGFQSSADRYAYRPGAMFSVAVVVLLALSTGILSQTMRRLSVVMILVRCAGLGVMAERQVGVWRSDETMWLTVLGYFPAWHPNKDLQVRQDHYARGRYKEALPHLQKAIDEGQRAFDAHLYMGLSLQRLGDEDGARFHLKRGIELAPDSVFHLQRATIGHIEGGRFDIARQLIRRVQELAPELRGSLRQLALLNLEQGDIPAARKILQGMVNERPEDAPSWVLLGVIEQLTGHVEQARGYYREALAADPGSRDARHNLSELEKSTEEQTSQ